MIKEKSCGAVVFKKENNSIKLLIIKQHDNCWTFPKGHVENSETEEETAKREIKEETNIDALIDNNFRKVITYSPKEGVLKDVVFFVGKALSDEIIIDPNELYEAKWEEIDKIEKLFVHENITEVFKSAENYINKYYKKEKDNE